MLQRLVGLAEVFDLELAILGKWQGEAEECVGVLAGRDESGFWQWDSGRGEWSRDLRSSRANRDNGKEEEKRGPAHGSAGRRGNTPFERPKWNKSTPLA